MRNLLVITLALIALLCPAPIPSFAAEAATNHIAERSDTNTNQVPSASDPALQARAREVWHKIIVFGVIAFLGAVVVAAFALYGAYRKFGMRGVFVVAVILAFGIFVLGGLLLLF
jgi:hypothetical protein